MVHFEAEVKRKKQASPRFVHSLLPFLVSSQAHPSDRSVVVKLVQEGKRSNRKSACVVRVSFVSSPPFTSISVRSRDFGFPSMTPQA